MVNEKLKNLKKVKSFDITEFDGMKSKIGSVELSEIEKKDFGKGLVETQQIIVKSENLAQEGSKEVTAIEYVSLKYDDEIGEFGIPEGANSKAMMFLNFFKVEDFDELVGKDITIVKRVKDTKEFLGIHHG